MWILAWVLFPGYSFAQDYVPGEVIVKLRSQDGSQDSFAFMGKAHSDKKMTLKSSFGKMNMYHFALGKGKTVEATLAELRTDPNVEYAEPNYLFRKSDDTGIIRTYTVQELRDIAAMAPATWSTGGADINLSAFHQSKNVSAQSAGKAIVAVIDTGLDLNHEVFADTDAIWTNTGEIANNNIDDDDNGYVDDINGWNFVDNSKTMYDDDGHGTHVSGIIMSVDQDVLAVTLTDSRIAIMPLKFLDDDGVGSTSNAIRAIYYAVNNGAQVLNNSWGGPSYSGSLHEAIAYAYSKGVVFVAAAGNSAGNNDSYPMYPASYDVPNVVSVAATTSTDTLASFSNFGKNTVHLGSPGVMIYSTLPNGWNGGWGSSSGTSMAAPFVAGVAIQMKVEAPSMLAFQIKSIIFSQADAVGALNNKVYTNSRLNAANSINYSANASVDSSQPAYYGSFSQNRELASNLAGAGCGLVSKLYRNSKDRFGGGDDNNRPSPGPQTWYVLVIIALLAAPMLIAQWMKSDDPAQRRRFERFRINSEVKVHVGDQKLVGSISTISLGGVQLNTEAMLSRGGVVKMQISSPDGKEQFEVEGRVVWSEERKAYGVAFSNAPSSVLSRITNWTKSLQKAS